MSDLIPAGSGPSQAIIGKGTRVGYADDSDGGSGGFTAFGEVYKGSAPKFTTADVKVSHFQSPDGIHEYTPGWADGGTVDLEMNYTKDERVILLGLRGVRGKYFAFEYPDGSTEVFPGYVKEVGLEVPNEDKMTSKVQIRVTGPSVYSAD